MEKRLYQRVSVGIPSNFIIKANEPGYREFEGVIDDLSESGIKIHISGSYDSNIVDSIKAGDRIEFQALDEYEMYGESRMDIFSGVTEVKRVDTDGDDIIIGCKVIRASQEFVEYVKNKKMALFMDMSNWTR